MFAWDLSADLSVSTVFARLEAVRLAFGWKRVNVTNEIDKTGRSKGSANAANCPIVSVTRVSQAMRY